MGFSWGSLAGGLGGIGGDAAKGLLMPQGGGLGEYIQGIGGGTGDMGGAVLGGGGSPVPPTPIPFGEQMKSDFLARAARPLEQVEADFKNDYANIMDAMNMGKNIGEGNMGAAPKKKYDPTAPAETFWDKYGKYNSPSKVKF